VKLFNSERHFVGGGDEFSIVELSYLNVCDLIHVTVSTSVDHMYVLYHMLTQDPEVALWYLIRDT